MTEFERLKAELDADRARIEAQDWAVTLVEDFLRKLCSHGFRPTLRRPGGIVTIAFDIGFPKTDDAPEDPPAPAVEDAAPEPVPGPARVTLRGKEWSAAEVTRMREIIEAGGSNLDVARALGRSKGAVSPRCAKMRRELATMERNPAAGTAPPVPAPVPASSPDAAGSSGRGIEQPVATPAAARQVQATIDTGAAWTPARDLQLVEGLARGDGLPAVADALGCTRKDAGARWRQLCPVVTLDAQVALLTDLRRQVGAGAGA